MGGHLLSTHVGDLASDVGEEVVAVSRLQLGQGPITRCDAAAALRGSTVAVPLL